MTQTLRAAEAADLAELVRLESLGMGADAWTPAIVADELAGVGDSRRAVVAVGPGGALLAYGVLRVVAGTADVHRVVVDPAVRRQGWGTRVLCELVAIAESCGCTEVVLEVSADNDAAQRLYQRAGFAEIARRRGYYRSGGDAVVLRRAISPGGV